MHMKKVVAYIFLSAILFSTMEVALKIAGNQMDAFQITFIRFLIGGLFLFPFALREIRKLNTTFTRKDYLHMLAMGIVCICISMIFFQLGVQHSNASTAAVIFCINPLFTMMFAHFMTEEKLNKIKLIALAVGLLGIIFMINPLNMEPGNTVLGVTFTISSALTFGLYSAMGRTSIQRLGGLTQTCISFILGSLVMLPILWILKKPVISGISMDNLIMILYVSIMITGLGYLFYFLAMEKSDAATASIVFFVKPGVAPIIAVIFLHEVIRLNGFIGIGLIFAGSLMNLKSNRIQEYLINRDRIKKEKVTKK